MKELEMKLGHEFKNINLLRTALTHSSYANEHRCQCYERMEFLGDSVLSVIVSDFLYAKMMNVNEGELSRIRASLVCEESLARAAKKIDLANYILLGNGEEKSGSRYRASITSDVFEATIAALYLDGGIETARAFILDVMGEWLNKAVNTKADKDYKSRLQEIIQKRHHEKTKIEYNTIHESGPEHRKVFFVELVINGKKVADGSGHSKKEAEQMAAGEALNAFL